MWTLLKLILSNYWLHILAAIASGFLVYQVTGAYYDLKIHNIKVDAKETLDKAVKEAKDDCKKQKAITEKHDYATVQKLNTLAAKYDAALQLWGEKERVRILPSSTNAIGPFNAGTSKDGVPTSLKESFGVTIWDLKQAEENSIKLVELQSFVCDVYRSVDQPVMGCEE